MKLRGVLCGVVAAMLVTACATGHRLWPKAVPFDPENPKVYVLEARDGTKQIVVDQEPIFITRERATVVWELPQDLKLTFPDNAILIRAEKGEFACRLQDPKRYACTWEKARPRVFYKYTIKVQDGKDLLSLDPSMIGVF